jgi:protocatechuate 3,4-dioxygenase beta subunit
VAEEARVLAALADALQKQADATPTPVATPDSPDESSPTLNSTSTLAIVTQTLDPQHAILTPTAQPSGSPTPFPTLTPRYTPLPDTLVNAVFTLQDKREVCDPDTAELLLQIEVLDNDGQPLPGFRIQVTWEGGADYFFTGFYPQVSPGYADFSMQPDVDYGVRVGDRGQVENGLRAVECTGSDGQTYPGGWWLTFAQP